MACRGSATNAGRVSYRATIMRAHSLLLGVRQICIVARRTHIAGAHDVLLAAIKDGHDGAGGDAGVVKGLGAVR